MRSEFLLPFPPSTNNLFENAKRGRRKSDQYTAWLHDAGWMIRSAPDRLNRHTNHVKLTILVRKPDNRRRDVSNLIKAIEDLLVTHQIMNDDSQVQSVTVQWSLEIAHGAKAIVEDM